jgi:hypothetical protein
MMMGGAPPPMMGGVLGGKAGMLGGGAPLDGTKINKINRQRYIHVTPQCKHLPIAIRLIVDQAHVHDVLTAVSNSRLRIQITQVTLTHERNVARATQATGTGTVPPGSGMVGGMVGGTRPPMAVVPPGRGPGMMPPMGGFAGRPYPAAGGGERGVPANAEATSGFVDNARLFELSIYGIASLYERPGKPATSEATPAPTPTKP